MVATVVFVLATSLIGLSQELTVAAADLHSAMDEIGAAFQAKTGAHIKVIYGSSGNFFQQIQNGAPFDIFLCANADYPKKLDSAGLAAPNSYYEYARGKLVLMVSAKSNLDLHSGLRVLTDHAVKKVSIADPTHAPYGQAADSSVIRKRMTGFAWMARVGHNHPLVLAILAASTRFAAPNLLIASER